MVAPLRARISGTIQGGGLQGSIQGVARGTQLDGTFTMADENDLEPSGEPDRVTRRIGRRLRRANAHAR
jgi:hypothetical protein